MAALPAGEDVTAVGDSVMVAAEPNLEALLPGISIDAVVGREVDAGLSVVQVLAAENLLRDSVVFELGTNGAFSTEQFDQLIELAGGRRVVVVTNHCDRCSWTSDNNDMIRENCDATVNCAVADWEELAESHPEFFAADGIHIEIGGDAAQELAELIAAELH